MVLPTNLATANEPISAPWGDQSDGPDLRAVASVETMLGSLAELEGDDRAYVTLWQAYVRETGATLTLHIDKLGEEHVTVGFPCDAQARHRNRWFYFLSQDLKAVEGRRDLLVRDLRLAGMLWDQRPTNPHATTVAVRDYVRNGGRILITPDGEITEGLGVPMQFARGSQEEVAACQRAGIAYLGMRKRFQSDRQIKRILRSLGRRTDNGWLVLDRRSAESRKRGRN